MMSMESQGLYGDGGLGYKRCKSKGRAGTRQERRGAKSLYYTWIYVYIFMILSTKNVKCGKVCGLYIGKK